jgi:hypothetical protein
MLGLSKTGVSMARRSRKGDAAAIGMLLIIGVPIYLASKVYESVGWVVPAAVVAALIGLWIWSGYAKKQKRLAYLRGKYADEEVVQRIMGGTIWQGQTEEQLRDTIGDPAAVDLHVLKTKQKETWKYHHQGANRYGLRVTVENGQVVGWDQKA